MRNYWLFGILFVLAAIVNSCSDELEQSSPRLPGYMSFNVSERNKWADDNAPTRSSVEAPVRMDCSLEGVPLYMHTEVRASAPESLDEATGEEAYSTRGVRYTNDVFSSSSDADDNTGRPRITSFGVYAKRSSDNVPILTYRQIGTGALGDSNTDDYIHSDNETDYEWNVQTNEEIETVWDRGTADFYGYAPFFGSEGTPTDATHGLSITLSNGEPVLTYVAPLNAADQPDILTARHKGVEKTDAINEDVKLEFDHIMSAIKFDFAKGHKYNAANPSSPIENTDLTWSDGVNSYNITVDKIEILGAYKKGSYKLGDDPYSSSDDRWTVDTEAGRADFTCLLNKAVSGNATVELTPDYETATTGNVFMMVPQELTSDNKVKLTCTLVNTVNATDTKTMVLSMSLNNVTDSKWKPGYTYIYSVSLSDVTYVFDYNVAKTISKKGVSYNGQDFSDIEVRSYKVDANGRKEAVSWRAQHPVTIAPVSGVGSETEQTVWRDGTPDWIELWDNNGESGTAKVTGRHAGATENTDTRNWWYQLKVLDIGTPVLDLSLYDHYQEKQWKRSTANCYIVSSPGTYLIPLVYGNAITNGEENEKAYKSDKPADDHVMKVLKNNKGTNISSPYIQLDRPAKAAGVLWDEVDGIIKNVSIDQTVDGPDGYPKERGYLKFTIDPAKFNYGNAVLYITDNSDDILWSWHIWMIDPDDFENDMTTIDLEPGSGHHMTYANQNIGWVDGGKPYTGADRDGRIKLIQDDSGKDLSIDVNQMKSGSFTTQFTNVLYQWGRKDPMLGIINNQRRNLNTPYNNGAAPRENSSVPFTRMYYGAVSNQRPDLQDLIKNPNTIYGASTGDLYNDPLNGETRGGAYNLWGINCDKAKKTYNFYGKTVYDPSPVGFCVPPSKAFTKLVRDNFKENGNQVTTGVTNPLIVVPYCTDNTFNTTLLEFPCCGQRTTDASAQLQASGYYRNSHATGYYHTASPYSGDENYQLRIDVYTNSILFIPVVDTHTLGLRGDQSSAMFVRPVVYKGETNIAEADEDIPEENPLTFVIKSSGTITWDRQTDGLTNIPNRTIEYSKKTPSSDWSDWQEITSYPASTISVDAGDLVQFRNTVTTTSSLFGDQNDDDVPANYTYGETDLGVYHWTQFHCTAQFELFGNIMSMIYPDTYEDSFILPTGTNGTYTFCRMFKDCTTLTSAEHLVLPATDTPDGASGLQSHCYDGMFMGCTNLTAAPTLPATTLSQYCYYQMFKGCSSLTQAPDLPAVSLVSNCYVEMFNGCSSLQAITAMFTTTPTATYTEKWVVGVPNTGTFTKNSAAGWNVTNRNASNDDESGILEAAHISWGVPYGWTVNSVAPSRRHSLKARRK